MRLSLSHYRDALNIHLASGAFWQIMVRRETWPQLRRGVWPLPNRALFKWWNIGYWHIRYYAAPETKQETTHAE